MILTRNIFIRVCLLAFILLNSFLLYASGDFPAKATTLLSDFTNTLSAEQKNALERKLVEFNDSTSTQIAVVIIASTGSYEINDYTVRLAEQWGIGRKEKNNGLIILVAKEDRKVSIQVGYGLEPVITDALTKRIIENIIVPAFKQNLFYEGLNEATNVLMGLALGEFGAEGVAQGKTQEKGVPWAIIVIVIVMIIVVLMSRARSVKQYAQTNNLSFWAALALMNAISSKQRGSWNNFHSGSGGGFGGGGGGFGGFGGGSFGGGGSSGGW